jgi:hypothetical protein
VDNVGLSDVFAHCGELEKKKRFARFVLHRFNCYFFEEKNRLCCDGLLARQCAVEIRLAGKLVLVPWPTSLEGLVLVVEQNATEMHLRATLYEFVQRIVFLFFPQQMFDNF